MRLKELLDKTTKSFLIKTQNMKLCVTVLCFSIILWCPLVWQSKKKNQARGRLSIKQSPGQRIPKYSLPPSYIQNPFVYTYG